jgi:hypothetical protein
MKDGKAGHEHDDAGGRLPKCRACVAVLMC